MKLKVYYTEPRKDQDRKNTHYVARLDGFPYFKFSSARDFDILEPKLRVDFPIATDGQELEFIKIDSFWDGDSFAPPYRIDEEEEAA